MTGGVRQSTVEASSTKERVWTRSSSSVAPAGEPAELEAATRSAAEAERIADDVGWIRSYVVAEPTGSSAPCASTKRRVRRRSVAMLSTPGLPVDEIVKVVDTIVLRPDPAATAA